MTFKSTFVSALVLICALGFVAHADLEYTLVTTYSSAKKAPNPKQTPSSYKETDTYYVTNNKSRWEHESGNQTYTAKEISITRCDLNQRFHVDNALKIYTVSALDAKGKISQPTEKELKENLPTGKIETHYSLQEIGAEKIKGIDTKIYQLKITGKYSGIVAGHGSDYNGKIWVAGLQRNVSCDLPDAMPKSYTQIEALSTCKRKMIYENTRDVDAMNQLSSKLPLRGIGTAEGQTVSGEVTSISQDKLNDSIFDIPAGYRKVSSDEYENLRSDAEDKAILKTQNSKAHR